VSEKSEKREKFLFVLDQRAFGSEQDSTANALNCMNERESASASKKA